VPQDQTLPERSRSRRNWRWSDLGDSVDQDAVNKWIKDQLNLIYEQSHAMELVSFYTEDHKEATRAFTEKRKPKFTGK